MQPNGEDTQEAADAAGGAGGSLQVEEAEGGLRLDVFLQARLPEHSRSRLKEAVRAGEVLVEGERSKPGRRVAAGERIVVALDRRAPAGPLPAEAIPFGVLHEDATLIVVDKPAGLVVHPGNGRANGTLVNGLLHRFGPLTEVGGRERPGIVHRLDRDTTGVMVVARTERAHVALSGQFQDRSTEKEYLALVEGEAELDGDLIDKPLGRSTSDPQRVVIDEGAGKEAVTRWSVEERFRGYTLVRCFPKTGRTHQIRVHLASIGLPIACDATYGTRKRLGRRELASNEEGVLLERQALHAHRLTIQHPLEGRRVSYEAPLHPDMERCLEALRSLRSTSTRSSR